MTKLILDTAKLAAYITTTMKTYTSNGERVHIAFVSAFHAAVKTGNPALLNRVYMSLRSNDQTAAKFFVRRSQIIAGLVLAGADAVTATPDGLPTDEILLAHTAGACLELKAGEFTVLPGVSTGEVAKSDAAKVLNKLIDERFAEPDGERDRMMLDRNNFAEVKTLGDAEILAQIVKLAKSIEANSDTKQVTVTKKVADWLVDIKAKAETMLDLSTLAKG